MIGLSMRRPSVLALAIALLLGCGSLAAQEPDGAALFVENCASCHGADRLGGTGPALLPVSLARLRSEAAIETITNGRPSTQMPAFAETLDSAEIAAVAAYIYSEPEVEPRWTADDIIASHVVTDAHGIEAVAPVYDADPLHMFLVVESGDHHITLLDGDRLEPIHRFATRFALHGGPKFSPDGRFTYLASRDGWITKYDLYTLQVVAEIRAGLNTRNIAVSADGEVVAVANYLPNTLVMLDADDLSLMKVIDAVDLHGDTASRVSAVYQAAPRESFIVALKDIPEIWEIPWAEGAVVQTGLAHSNEAGAEEVLPSSERFPIRRILLDAPLDDFFFAPDYHSLIGAARGGDGARVIQLDVGREIARLPINGLPHLGSGISWQRDGHTVMATPNLNEGEVSIIDLDDWQVIKTIETLGPGFFMRSHEESPYAWVDVFFGEHRDAMQVIDKQSLEIVATLVPEPGRTSGHVEFTWDGRYALVSIWEMDGAIVVYDAQTLEEIKRIPMVKPSGKYNVYNKLTLSEGTSH